MSSVVLCFSGKVQRVPKQIFLMYYTIDLSLLLYLQHLQGKSATSTVTDMFLALVLTLQLEIVRTSKARVVCFNKNSLLLRPIVLMSKLTCIFNF